MLASKMGVSATRRLCRIGINFWPTRGLSTSVRSPEESFRLAVVGSGPAGFYTAYRVMSRIPGAKVDMYETLPVPFGLVRHGVAPDHPEVKNCQDKFNEIASSPNFAFIGNVSVGQQGQAGNHCTVDLATLTNHYNSVLFAYGASEDKKLGIPGESTLKGIYSAREFVGWYNGLPDCAHFQPDLELGDEAVIIGQGNVALDVARMLLEDVDVLRKTDIADHALAGLARSKIRRVHVVGRRGPMQAAFTIKEVRELMRLKNVGFHPVDRSLIPQDLTTLPRASRRIMEVIVSGSNAQTHGAPRSWSLESCLTPRHFIGRHSDPTCVASTEFEVNYLEHPFEPRSTFTSTGKSVVLGSDVVFRSAGYMSVPLPGFAEAGIQFNAKRGIIENDGCGRVTRLLSSQHSHGVQEQQVPGLYCAGWVKRGPTGVIASTMSDAFTTGDAMVDDWLSGAAFLNSSADGANGAQGWSGLQADIGPIASSSAVSWDQWLRIDQVERSRGRERGKERDKFTRVKDMLDVLG